MNQAVKKLIKVLLIVIAAIPGAYGTLNDYMRTNGLGNWGNWAWTCDCEAHS